tara:strand:+ start:1898 stop:2464 length:567 start_codon:yes stop_codon:yes gene_type:complete
MHDFLTAIVILGSVGLTFGLILGFASEKFKVKAPAIVEQIDAILPQTQCGQCGYPGCKPYAEAIAQGDQINKCPPGGYDTVVQIAELMNVEPEPITQSQAEHVKKVAFIREDECIGCTKCIQACPVDAIVGARKLMHSVITQDCTGCDLCVAPCPVDCIEMRPVPVTTQNWQWDLAIPIRMVEEQPTQ